MIVKLKGDSAEVVENFTSCLKNTLESLVEAQQQTARLILDAEESVTEMGLREVLMPFVR